MGCWNETCGITQMPIEGGDPVCMFLLVQNKMYSSSEAGIIHGNCEMWRPFGLPLRGKYDEYGRIEKIKEDVFSDLMLESLKEILIEVPNRMGDEITRANLTWEEAIDRLTDEGLRVADPFSISRLDKKINEAYDLILKAHETIPKDKWSPELSDMASQKQEFVKKQPEVINMYHMMVHESVYTSILKHKVCDRWGSTDIRKNLYEGAQQYIDDVRAHIEKMDALTDPDARSLAEFSRSISFRHDHDNRFVSACNYLDGSPGSGTYLNKYFDFLEKKIRAGAPDSDPEIKALTDQIIGFLQFNRAMSYLRKQWQPQCGKGGQDAEYEMHKFIAKVTTNFCNKKIKDYDQ